LAYGVNGLSVSLMVVVFASTAGITGAEVGIAGGSAVIGQKLLEAVFGDQAVRRLAESARKDLNARVLVLLEEEKRRFVGQLDKLEISMTSPEEIREVSRRVDDLRFAQKTAQKTAERTSERQTTGRSFGTRSDHRQEDVQ
ncbi:MAG: ABC transporter, partial [Marmoricola sp.]